MPHGSHHNFKLDAEVRVMPTPAEFQCLMEAITILNLSAPSTLCCPCAFQCLMEAITILNMLAMMLYTQIDNSFNASWKPSQF